MKKTAFSLIAILALSQLTYAGGDIAPVEPIVEAPVVEDTNTWQQEITVYGWLPTISATTPFPESPGSSIDTSDILDDLKMAFLGTYAARYDKWSFVADVIYADIGNSATQAITFPEGTFDATVGVDMKTLLMNAGIGYNIVDSENLLLDLVAGVRYLDLEVDVSTNLPRHPGISASEDFVDFTIGARGFYNINENWYLPYEADIGTGDSKVSYQLFAGVGYRYDWGDIKLGYRYLDYDMGDGHIVEDLSMSGGILGVSIKF